MRLLIPAQRTLGTRSIWDFRRDCERQPRRDRRAKALRPLPRRIRHIANVDIAPAVDGEKHAAPGCPFPAVKIPQLPAEPWPEEDMDVRACRGCMGAL